MQFPDDDNGDVLRRMAASGFDFGRVRDVDFFAVFRVGEDATLVAKQLVEADRSENCLASVSTDTHESGETELKVVRKMLVTHDNITKFELLLGELCAKHGGAMDGWGVLQDSTENDTSVPDDSHPAPRPSRIDTRLNSPGDDLDEVERNFVDGIRQHGWMQTHVLDEDDKPGFSFTTGFEVSIGHPEILAFKIDKQVVNEIFWLLYRCAQNGMPVPRAMRTGGVLPTDDAYIFPVARRHYAKYLGWSRWFYRGDDFECLQVVWPDQAGIFPWEDGFDTKYANAQIDLTDRGWAAEVAG
jgi:hypothetical protein